LNTHVVVAVNPDILLLLNDRWADTSPTIRRLY
jgi:hypothetical protein